MTDLTSLTGLDAEEVTALPSDRDLRYSGRRAFSEGLCDKHPGTTDNPCAKFGHLPGNGRGTNQPRWYYYPKRLFVTGLKPLLFLTVVFAGYFIIKHGFHPANHGGGLLRPGSNVHSTACPMPNSAGQSSTSRVPANSTSPCRVSPSRSSNTGDLK